MTFTPHAWQTSAVAAYERYGGVFVGLDPGVGKTYAAAQIAARCRRPLVVAPAAAVKQTMAQFRAYGVGCRRANDPLAGAVGGVAFASYTWLTGAAQADFFERYRPTDVLMDEFHEVRGLDNSARKRLERYLVAHPAVRVGVFTASPMSSRVHDFAYGLHWALRAGVRGLVPPLRAGLDALQTQLDRDPAARADFRRRLEATPGVFLDSGDAGRYAGVLELHVLRRAPALVLPPTWETPSGFLIESAAHAAEVEKMLAWGYYPEVSPRPSAAYVEARRRWGGVVRRAVDQGLADTEYQVRGLQPEAYAVWASAEAAEGPLAEAEAVWVSTALDLPETPEGRPALVWAHHRALQDHVASTLRAPLFREGARSREGSYLPDYRGRVAVASIEACHQSLNLQHFSHSLVLEPPSDPEVWKQLLGRTARQGQTAARVTCDVVVNCLAAERALRGAVDKARSVYETTGKSNPLLTLLTKDW